MRVWVGSAIERSSFGSPSEEFSSEDSWVDFSSYEWIVDFPEDDVLPVVGWQSSMNGDDAHSEVNTCLRGDCCCGDFVDLMEMSSMISFKNEAVFVRLRSFIVDCLILGEICRDGGFEDLLIRQLLSVIIPSCIFNEYILQMTGAE